MPFQMVKDGEPPFQMVRVREHALSDGETGLAPGKGEGRLRRTGRVGRTERMRGAQILVQLGEVSASSGCSKVKAAIDESSVGWRG